MTSSRIFSNQHLLSVLVSLLFAVALAGNAWGQAPLKSSLTNDAWQIKWNVSDEFNGNEPDWRKWSKNEGLPETNSWLWGNSDNLALLNGNARLTLRHNVKNVPVKSTYFHSAILKSYRTFTYGYFEARMRAASFRVREFALRFGFTATLMTLLMKGKRSTPKSTLLNCSNSIGMTENRTTREMLI